MDVRKYFTYTPELELTVAQIGINKWNWIFIPSKDEETARKIMADNRFDILPISRGGDCKEYYKTNKWGQFDSIDVVPISHEDKLYYRLSFIDLLPRMRQDKKYFYFLADAEQILGLISLNNLNSLAVYNYIYQITAALEQEVSNFLKDTLTEEEVIEILKKTSDKQANDLVKEFFKLKENNTDNSIFEHLYFPTLSTLLKYAAPKLPQEKYTITDYRTKFCAEQLYHKIRNCVSHPVRPLFVDENSVNEVYELISDYIVIKHLLN